MKLIKPSLLIPMALVLILLIFLAACETDFMSNIDAQICQDVSYANQIQPIIGHKCSECHGANNPNGDFSEYEKMKPWLSEIRAHVFVIKNMPPQEAPQLTLEETGLLQCWLNQGAPQN